LADREEKGEPMKRLVASLCVLAFAVAFVPAVSTGSAGGPYDSVSGSGWRGNLVNPTTPISHFAVSAQDGPSGVFGTYSSESPNALLNFRGNVTCLYVNGDHAVVGGVVTSGGDVGQVGTGFAVGFIDNPSPAPDTVTLSDVTIPPAVDCVAEAALFTIPTLPFVRGNVEVNDAP
jgi:hypothetical protein